MAVEVEERSAYQEHYQTMYKKMFSKESFVLEETDAFTVRDSGYSDQEMCEEIMEDLYISKKPTRTHTTNVHGYYDTGYDYSYQDDISTVKSERDTTFSSDITFIIPKEIHQKIQGLVDTMAEKGLEIGGLLKGNIVDEKLVISDFVTLPQRVSGGDFEVEDEALATWMGENIDDTHPEQWCGWWHSHHTMALFWSGTDDDMFTKLLDNDKQFCFGIVLIKGGDTLCRIDLKNDVCTLSMDNIPYENEGEAVTEAVVNESAKEAITECIIKPSQKKSGDIY